MPTYPLTAINVGSFALGEADKVITLFSKERGIVKAVAKGARKPGAKFSGKSELLCVNKLLLAKGKSLDIITQAESLETFSALRVDLERLTFGLYFAELTRAFSTALEEDCAFFYELLFAFLARLTQPDSIPGLLAMEFELALLQLLGLRPQLEVCILCRQPLTEYSISVFVKDMGGICCQSCADRHGRRGPNYGQIREYGPRPERSLTLDQEGEDYPLSGTYITPLVWKLLVLACARADRVLAEGGFPEAERAKKPSEIQKSALKAARKILERYLEDKAGKRMKSLDLLESL